MSKRQSPDVIRQQLEAKKEAISLRIDALQDEVVSTPDDIKASVAQSPWVGVGAAVVAGLAVGLLFGGRKKKAFDINRHDAPHQALIARYVDAMVHEVRRAVERGHDPDDAVRAALDGRVPLIVMEREPRGPRRGFFRQTLDLAFKTALGFAVKTALDMFTANLDLEQLQQFMDETETQQAETQAVATAAAADASEARHDAARAEMEARHAAGRPAGASAAGPGTDVAGHPLPSQTAPELGR